MDWEGKVWGRVSHLFYSDQLGVSYLQVNSGFCCSWHLHHWRANGFLVKSGRIQIELRDKPPVILSPGEFYLVPSRVDHRFCVLESGEVIEVYWSDRPGAGVQQDDIHRWDQGGAWHVPAVPKPFDRLRKSYDLKLPEVWTLGTFSKVNAEVDILPRTAAGVPVAHTTEPLVPTAAADEVCGNLKRYQYKMLTENSDQTYSFQEGGEIVIRDLRDQRTLIELPSELIEPNGSVSIKPSNNIDSCYRPDICHSVAATACHGSTAKVPWPVPYNPPVFVPLVDKPHRTSITLGELEKHIEQIVANKVRDPLASTLSPSSSQAIEYTGSPLLNFSASDDAAIRNIEKLKDQLRNQTERYCGG